jgi:co-chaperonin GroES (HSP10)
MSTLKPLGCRVLLLPFPEAQTTASGFVLPNTYKRANIKFRVEAVGPGEFVRRKKKPPIWVAPEVRVGDIVFSRHWLSEPPPGFHRPAYIDCEDESSRVIVDARLLLATHPREIMTESKGPK